MNNVQGRISGLSHGRVVPFALRVVLAIDNVNGSSALEPEQAHGLEVVKPEIADLQASHFRDTEASYRRQRSEQPVSIESHRLRVPPKQEGHNAFVNRKLQTKGTAHETRNGLNPASEDVAADQRRIETQDIVPMLNCGPN
jgi:hypothetical protein